MTYQITKNGKRLADGALIFAPSIDEALQALPADAGAKGLSVARIPSPSNEPRGVYYGQPDRRRRPLLPRQED